MKPPKIVLFCIILLFLVSACNTKQGSKEKVVELGKTITFDYATGFDNGTLFDTSFETIAKEAGIFDPNRIYGPERAIVGEDPLIPGLVEALLGLKEGETKNVRIPPNKAYGIKIENSTNILHERAFDNPENLKVNDIVIIATPEGDRIPVFIRGIDGKNITIDLNHPLAGHYIQFSIILRSIE